MSAWIKETLAVKTGTNEVTISLDGKEITLGVIEARSLAAWLWREAANMEAPSDTKHAWLGEDNYRPFV